MTGILSQLRGDIPHRLIEDHWTVDFEALDAERKKAADEIERMRMALMILKNVNEDGNSPSVFLRDVIEAALEGK